MSQHLEIGTMVSTRLYNRGIGYVIAIHGKPDPDSVRTILGGVVRAGGNATYDIVFASGTYSPGLPECILLGGSWRIYSRAEGFATAEDIARHCAFADKTIAAATRAREAAEAAFAAEVTRLRTDPAYADLTQGDEGCGVLAAKNIRKLLKRTFPGTKFSVRKDHYSSLTVGWTAGPLRDEVEAITEPFVGSQSSECGDFRDRHRTPWNTVFGHADYIWAGPV